MPEVRYARIGDKRLQIVNDEYFTCPITGQRQAVLTLMEESGKIVTLNVSVESRPTSVPSEPETT